MWLTLIVTAIICTLIYKLFLSNPNKNFWRELGVLEIDISPAVTLYELLTGKKGQFAGDDYAYLQLGPSQKFCGLMETGRPMLLVKDLDLVKKILIKDFDHFVDRRKIFTEAEGSLNKMLPNLSGDEWKGVRSSISPTFTTGKIRRMMEIFNSVGKEWVEHYTEKANASSGSFRIDAQAAIIQYTVDVIATAVFGMKTGTVKNPKNTFSVYANRLPDFSKWQLTKFTFRLYFPRIGSLLGLCVIDKEALDFFENILGHALKERLKGNTKRNDFLQLLCQAKKGELKTVDADELSQFEKDAQIITSSEKKQFLTNEVMNGQSMIFFFAGFSTTSNFITFTLYALSLHQDIQNRLRAEVKTAFNGDGSLDYDELGKLAYLDMVVSEVLRKFAGVARLERVCVKDYKDPESGLSIPKGVLLSIPLNAIHHDTRYYDHPSEFDPEHFSPEKKAQRNPYAYMPFGMGPRNCIGMRFALVEGKAAIAHMVHNFRIEPTSRTPRPLQGKPMGITLIPPKNLELKLTAIKT